MTPDRRLNGKPGQLWRCVTAREVVWVAMLVKPYRLACAPLGARYVWTAYVLSGTGAHGRVWLSERFTDDEALGGRWHGDVTAVSPHRWELISG